MHAYWLISDCVNKLTKFAAMIVHQSIIDFDLYSVRII